MDLGSSIRRRRKARGKDAKGKAPAGPAPPPGDGRPPQSWKVAWRGLMTRCRKWTANRGARLADWRERVALRRAKAGSWRERARELRERAGDWRGRANHLRERVGDWRERASDLHDRAGDWRERAGDLRERAGDLRRRAGDGGVRAAQWSRDAAEKTGDRLRTAGQLVVDGSWRRTGAWRRVRRAGRAGGAGARRTLRGLAAATPRIPMFKDRPLLSALVVGGGGLASGYLVATTFFFRPPPPPPALQGVPDLRGYPLAMAMSVLADSGLATSRVDSVHHPSVVGGIVIGQSPLPGRTALPQAPVRVTVSLGPDVRPVPDVTRLPGSRAAALLAESGFVVAVDTIESMAPAGRVIRIEPSPGTPVEIPGGVRVAVSLGPPTIPMPSLAGLSEQAAMNLLQALGLVVSQIEYRYSLLNVNVIFGQYPDPNAQIEQGAEVQLIVGRRVRQPFGTFFRRSPTASPGARGAG
ncbi:MAG: PASTA domain-containing protein [Gemmatimonadetes bacterium]|nr:PASTA domain-containing protein [Gemmatimonadota bacterium]